MRKTTAILITIFLLAALAAPASAADNAALERALGDTAAYVYQTTQTPQVGSVGGEWAVIGLARGAYDAPDLYYENYYRAVESCVRDCKGVLHDKKYTEYSRVILALTAAGYDPRDVAGYDLTLPLGDFEKTVWQGVNGPIFALLALDSLNYPVPANKAAQTQATRQLYVAEILRRQTPDGGWSLTADSGDADLTGMALQALAKYQAQPEVKAATDRALAFLSGIQDGKGGYENSFSSGSSALESVVQVIVALGELGISVSDTRFVKNGCTLIDNLLSFQNADGSFRHTQNEAEGSQMSTEQALYALAAARRAADGKNSLYRMSDAVKRGGSHDGAAGLPGKHADVSAVPVTSPGKTFPDVQNHANRRAIEALASRGVINGNSETAFDPDATMTRAQFAAIVSRGLGLPEKTVNVFSDVAETKWYARPIATAYHYEIIKGVSATMFNPEGTITRQEAAVMTARAARLCGMDTARTEAEIRNTLAQFGDYRAVESWAGAELAFCFSTGILSEADFGLNIEPSAPILRCEIAEMLYRMLYRANLL